MRITAVSKLILQGPSQGKIDFVPSPVEIILALKIGGRYYMLQHLLCFGVSKVASFSKLLSSLITKLARERFLFLICNLFKEIFGFSKVSTSEVVIQR
jgi:hypothetical protein